jgi:hypothetical protein
MKRILLIILITTVALVGGIVFLLIYESHQEDTREYAIRLICKSRQKDIYSALIKYHKEYGQLPSHLAILVKQGYVREKDIYCPARNDDPNTRIYKYLPQNFGDPNLPLISENVENHYRKGLRLRNLKSAIIETMGDGTTVTRNVSSED